MKLPGTPSQHENLQFITRLQIFHPIRRDPVNWDETPAEEPLQSMIGSNNDDEYEEDDEQRKSCSIV